MNTTAILLDDPYLLRFALKSARELDFKSQGRWCAGYSKGHLLQKRDRKLFLLTNAGYTAAPLVYLSVAQLAFSQGADVIISVSGGYELTGKTRLGDLSMASAATALPYPALYQNRQPQAPCETTEHYPASRESIDHLLHSTTTLLPELTWQKHLPVLQTGYCKHPTLGGGLMPWAPEQFEAVRSAGIDIIAEVPAGVLEAQQEYPAVTMISLVQTRQTVSRESAIDWQKHSKHYYLPARQILRWVIAGGYSRSTGSTSTIS